MSAVNYKFGYFLNDWEQAVGLLFHPERRSACHVLDSSAYVHMHVVIAFVRSSLLALLSLSSEPSYLFNWWHVFMIASCLPFSEMLRVVHMTAFESAWTNLVTGMPSSAWSHLTTSSASSSLRSVKWSLVAQQQVCWSFVSHVTVSQVWFPTLCYSWNVNQLWSQILVLNMEVLNDA